MKLFFKVLLALSFLVPVYGSNSTSWVVSREWGPQEEKLFGEFIAKIGEGVKSGQCHTTDQCLRSPVANPLFYRKNPVGLEDIFSDCADLPHVLRAYFAFMRQLPFVFPSKITFYSPELESVREELRVVKKEYESYSAWRRPRPLRKRYKELKKLLKKIKKGLGKDIRYSRSGNKITELTKIRNGDNINSVLTKVVNTISTASFRVHAGLFDQGSNFRDTYPVKVNKEGIRAGTILYDPAGHIALVSKVTKSGKIYLIDAHPDNSITYISYGEKFSRSADKIGAGFLSFRPYNSDYIGTQNSDLKNYSLEQYYGTNLNSLVPWRKAQYTFEGQGLKYHEFVRARLSNNGLVIRPIEELDIMLEDLCRDFQDRAKSVEKAIARGLQEESHPDKLPENIYGTDGEWETFSTPSRDARLKTFVREVYNTLRIVLGDEQEHSFQIEYNGHSLKSDLRSIYRKKTKSCQWDYLSSLGEAKSMNLEEGIQKLFALSFDPYHCIELRWGQTDSLPRVCSAKSKMKWYSAESSLRNQLERDYSKFMGVSLRQLPGSGLGVKVAPNFDFYNLLH
jgi:hypothetical protein